jgi:hypothetical protein
VELGYEKAEIGPTTNFVGNHMTQGAIDLVQAELGQTRLMKSSLQKKIDFVQKVETSKDCSRTLAPDSTSDVAQQAEEFSHSKAEQTMVDVLHLVPSEGPPDLSTIRKYIRRNCK